LEDIGKINQFQALIVIFNIRVCPNAYMTKKALLYEIGQLCLLTGGIYANPSNTYI